MVANGSLTIGRSAVENSVAKPTVPLPSSSPSQSRKDMAAQEVEGKPTALGEDRDVAVFTSRAETSESTQANALTANLNTPEAEADSEPAEENARVREEERLAKMAENINERLNDSLEVRFRRDEETGVSFFQFVDRESGEVVRQTPPEHTLEFMKKFQSFTGMLFSEQA